MPKPEKKEVRFLSTTNTAIRSAVETGDFVEDLMYRLRGVVIEVPPLRARPEDIPSLAYVFAQDLGVKDPTEWFTEDVLALMVSYRWPENVHELRQVVEDLVLAASHRQTRVEDLSPRFRGADTF